MRFNTKKLIISLSFVLISSFYSFSQTVPFNNANFPNHKTIDQRTIEVAFINFLSGSTDLSQWTITINGSSAGISVTGLGSNAIGPYSGTLTIPATSNVIYVRFDASGVSGHSASTPYLLPGEVLRISFNNIANTLKDASNGLSIASFGPLISKNNYVPPLNGALDILYQSEGIASVLDQCSPVNTDFFRWTYLYSLRFRNSQAWSTPDNKLRISWGSGASTSDLQGYLSNSGGDPSPTQAPVNSFTGGNPGVFVSFRSGLNITSAAAGITNIDGTNQFIYPDNTGVCNFRTAQYPRAQYNIGIINVNYDAVGSPTLQRNTQFNSYDYDDQNTGTLAMTPSTPPTTATSELVCLGTNVGVQFTDASTFNCIGNGTVLPTPGQGAATTPINNQQRWVRIIYGGANSAVPANVIPNIQVGGVPVTDASGALDPNWDNVGHPILPGTYSDMTPNGSPMDRGYVFTGGGADANGVITLPANATVPSVVSQLITTSSPAGQAVGQRFYVTLQYWGVCNPYPTSAPVEISADFVEIITKPVPPTAVNKDFCFDQDMSAQNFEITSSIGGARQGVRWYNSNPTLGGATLLTNPNGTNSLTFPSQAAVLVPFGLSVPNSIAGGGTYSLWATQLSATNACESDPVQVTIRKREELSPPGAISNTDGATFPVCAGTSGIDFTVPAAAGSTTIGGAAEYFWSVTAGTATINGSATGQTVVVDVPAGASGTQTISVVRRYTTNDFAGSRCTTAPQTFNFTVDPTTVGGTVAGPTEICAGQNTGLITLSGNTGSIVRWEVNGVTDATLGTANPINPIINASGTYTYQAFVKSGVCPAVGSTVNLTVTVAAVPGKPSIASSAAGNTACEGDAITLTAGNVGAATYNWFKEPAPWTPNQASTTLQAWYRGDLGVTVTGVDVTQWNDQSGNSRHLTQGTSGNRPDQLVGALNGLSVIDFDGTDDFLRGTLGNPGSFSVFTVAKSDVAAQTGVLLDVSNNTANTDRRYSQMLDAGNYRSRLSNNGGTQFNASRTFNDVTGYHIFYGDHATNTNAKASIDGVPLTVTAANGTLNSATNHQLGRSFANSRPFNGQIAEMVIFSNVISLADRQRVEGYLAHKWGLTANLPSDHPYKNTAPLNSPIQSSASTLLNNLDVPSESGTYRVQAIGGGTTACVSEPSNNITITINTRPTVVLSGGGSVCAGNPAPDVVFTFTGTGPYNLVYSINGTNQPAVNGVTSPYTITNPAVGTYAVVSISDSNTPSCIVTAPNANITGSAIVSISATPPPTVQTFTATTAVCDDGVTTNPPDALLDLDPDITATYNIGYKLVNLSTLVETNVPAANFTSNASGLVTISPTYAQLGNAPLAAGYQIVITSIFNTTTLCAGAVPINGPTLIVNPRPSAPLNPVRGIACSTAATGATISVDAPPVGYTIVWSTTAAPTFTAAAGVTGGTRGNAFTPTSNATATYYAFTRDDVNPTNCLSATSLAVQHIQDVAPTASNAGTNAANCTGTFTLNANAPLASEMGTWTVPGIGYQQNFNSFTNGTTSSTAINGWTIDVSGVGVFAGGAGTFQVNAGQFEANNLDGSGTGGAEVVWRSTLVNGAFTNRSVSVLLSSSATLEASDYIRVYYRIDGGVETLLTNGNQSGSITGTVTASAGGLSGATSLQIVVRVNNNATDEFHFFDNILIADAGAPTITNANDRQATVSNLPVGPTILTWSITSLYGVCAASTSTVTLNRNALPVVVNPTPAICEGVAGSGFVNDVNLNAYSNTITGLPGTYLSSGASAFQSVGVGQDDRLITWYTNPARTTLVPNASDVDGLTNGAKRFYRVTIVSTGCTSDGEITFTINPLPSATNRTYTFCSDAKPGLPGDNLATINLATAIPATDILGAGPPANRALSYHLTLADAQSGASPIVGSFTINANTTRFARVVNTLTNCVNTATVNLQYQPRAANNQMSDASNNILVDGLVGSPPFSASKSICASGSLVLFQIDPSRNPGSTYSWTIPPVSYAGEFELLTGTNNYFIIMKFPNATSLMTSLYNGGIPISVTETLGTTCEGNTLTLLLNVDATPSKPIISGPAEVCENSLATYTITVGAGTTHTWAIPPGATITNSPTGSSINVQLSTFDGQVSVTASSGTGCTSPTSDPITVDAIPRPSFTFSTTNLCSGGNTSSAITLTPSIAAPYNPADVRYNVNVLTITGSVTGATVGSLGTGLTGISQVLTNTSGLAGSVVYQVTPVGPGTTACQGPTQNVTVNVNPEPVLNLTDKTLCSDEAANYEIKLLPTNLPAGTQFSWSAPTMSAGPAQGSAGTNVPMGAAGTIHINTAFTNTTNASITATYVISATSSLTSCSSTQPAASRTVVFTIAPKPTVSATLNTSACSDNPIGLTLATEASSVTASTYEIVSRTVSGGLTANAANVVVPATGVAAGYLANDRFTNVTSNPLTVTYVVRARGTINNCLGDTRSIVVTINPEPAIATTLDATVCSGENIGLTLATLGTSVAALNYNVISVTPQAGLLADPANVLPANGVAAGYLAAHRFTNTTSGNLTVTYVVEARGNDINNANCLGDQRSIIITINPEPVVSTSLNATRCSDQAINLTLATNGVSIGAASYNVISRTPQLGLTPAGTNVLVPANAVAANYLANDRFTNKTTGALTVTYVVEAVGTINSCLSEQRTIVITIDPEPVIPNLDVTRCSDEIINLNLSTDPTSVGASAYNIVSRTVQAGLTASAGNVGVPASGVSASYLANDVFTNVTAGALTVTYVVEGVGSINGCVGDTKTIVVTISPKPVVATTLDNTVCSDAAIGLILNTNGTSIGAANYNVISVTPQVGLVADGANVAPSNSVAANYLVGHKFTNTTSTALTVSYVVEAVGTINSCVSAQRTITMTINPEPVVATTLNDTKCSDTAIGLVLNTNGTSIGALNYNIISITPDGGLIPNGANVPVANGVAANYLQNHRFTNQTTGNLNVVYVVQAVGLIGNCIGDQRTITITISPEPIVANLNTNQCSDVAIGLTLNTDPIAIGASSYNIISRTVQSGLTPSAGNVGVPATGVAATYLANDKFTNTTTGSLTVTYVVEARGTLGNCVGDQKTIVITINPEPIVSTTLNATKCSDEAIGLTLSTSATAIGALNYNIVSRTIQAGLVAAGTNAVVPQSGVTTTYLSADRFTNTTSGSLTVTYVVEAVGTINNCVSDQRTIVMTIDPEPVISTTLNSTICSDVSTGLILNTNGTSITASSYNIISRTAQSGLTAAGTNVTVPASNVSANYLSNDKFTNVTNGALTVTYVVEARGAINSCIGDQRTIVITINPEPVISNALSTNRCSDVAIGLTLATTPSSVTALDYNIISRTIQTGLVANAGNATVPASNVADSYLANDRFTNTTNGDLTVTYVVEGRGSLGGCIGDQRTITMTINPEPVVATTLNRRQCNDEAIGLVLSTNGTSIAASTYNIISRTVQTGLVANGTNVAIPASGVSDSYLTNDRFSNPTTGSLTVTYVVEGVAASGCIGDQRTIVVTIDPEPVVLTTLNGTKCSDEAIALVLATNPLNVSASGYNIISRSVQTGLVANGSNVTVPANNVSASYVQNDRFTNTTSGALTVTYVVEAIGSINGCISDQRTIVMTINPVPVMANNLNETKCSDETYGKLLATNGTSVAATSYNITADFSEFTTAGLTASPTTGTALSASAIQNDAFTNTTNSQLRIFYTVTPNGPAGCVGAAKIIEFKVNPEPVLLNPGLDKTTCSDVATGLTFATNGTSVAATSYRITAFNLNGLTENVSNIVKSTSVFPITVSASQLSSEKFTNLTAASVDVSYTVVPIGPAPSSCVGDPVVVKVTVKPEPRIVPGAVPVCSGEAVGTAITINPEAGSLPADQYELKRITNAANLPAGGTNAGLGLYTTGNFLQNDVFINTVDANPRDVVYEVVPIAAGCRGEDAAGFGKLITLTVNPAPDLADNLGKTVCSGEASGISLSTRVTPVASAAALNYNITNITVAAGLVAAPSVNLTFPRLARPASELSADQFTNPTNAPLTVTYRVVPVTAAGCKGVEETVVLTVEPAITMIIPSNIQTCSDSPNSPSTWSFTLNSNVTPTAGNITFDYSATSSPVGAVTGFLVSQSNLPRLTNIADKLVNTSNNVATVTYSITPRALGAKSGVGCSAATPTLVTVTVEPKPRLSISPSTQTVCEGSASAMVLSSTTVPGTGTLQFIKVSAVATGGMTLTSTPKTTYLNGESITDVWSNPTTVAQTVTYSFRAQVSGGLGCISEDITVVLTVNPRPVVTATPQADICSGEFINITLTPDVSNTVANWSVSAPATVVGASNGAGNQIFQTLFNNGSVQETVTYTVTPRVNGCDGTALVIPVRVNPKPRIIGLASPVTICHGSTLSVNINNTIVGARYTWSVDNPSGLPGVTEQLVAGGGTITQPLTNTTGSQATLTYSITPYGTTGCAGDQRIMIVTVAPQINAQFVNASSSICKGSSEFLIIQIDGQAPFQLVYNDGTSDITVNNAGNFKVIQVKPNVTTTYTIKSIKDALNCSLVVPSQTVTVTVGETDANFDIVGPVASCGPYTASFKFNQVAGTEYTWQWFDGSADDVQLATTTVPNQTITHTFTNPNPNGAITYKVTLRTQLPAPFPGCFKSSTKNITVYPTIITNAFADRSEICSDESIQFFNQSFGVATHKWFYRVRGTNTELEARTTSAVNYKFVNNTGSNPLVYEVVYRADNGNCPAPDVIIPITVYRGITANFSEGTIPPYISGNSRVTFTNTSTPVDASQFRYEWKFGLNASPLTSNGAGPFGVNYSTPGSRDVTLTATNIAAETAGLSCVSEFTKNINIPLLPLEARFKVSPLRSCFPSEITVTENTSTGDVMEWRLIDNNGRTSATSNALLPVFKVTTPGKFSIFLTTRSSLTGQVANATPANVEIFDKPVASFQLRPTLVYVPDQEMATFNFSTGATDYLWEFGDGRDTVGFEPTHVYKIEGVYDVTLIAQYDHGDGLVCADTTTNKVTAKQGGITRVPNAFTPNSNGPSGGVPGNGGLGQLNDVFLPIVKGAEEFNMQVFDRWGNLIFESNSAQIGWDGYDKNGKLMPSGVYVYKLTLRLSDGQRTTQVGDITMIR